MSNKNEFKVEEKREIWNYVKEAVYELIVWFKTLILKIG
jgi:hypothetical protein